MKLVRVKTEEEHLIQNDEEGRVFKFDENGELTGLEDVKAWFYNKDQAIGRLLDDGFDEIDITDMEFEEFDYVPQIPSVDSSVEAAVIYDESGSCISTWGEDLSITGDVQEEFSGAAVVDLNDVNEMHREDSEGWEE